MFDPTGNNGLTPSRHLVNDRYIHLPKGSDCQGPRDRGRCHHEDIRIVTLLTENTTLINSKSVLFISND